jgi:poly(3-hydroxybutyrate) depolymerase
MAQDHDTGEAWLEQIRQLHEADKLRLQAEQAREKRAQAEPGAAAKLLSQTQAHLLMRQVQSVLLNGGGRLEIVEQPEDYDRAIVLMWHGPISAARRPDQAVNGKAIAATTPEALKAGLLAACKKPRRSRSA